MQTIIIAMRHHGGPRARAWLEDLPGTGTAYLTDILYQDSPSGKRRCLMPGGRDSWVEIPRPYDLENAVALAANGNDLLYKFPSVKRRRLFVRRPEEHTS